jgi:hypothetical protein
VQANEEAERFAGRIVGGGEIGDQRLEPADFS